jgi:drug/metabolite transporter (DMT)-like permease
MPADPTRRSPGIPLALGAAALFGLSMPAAKPLLATVDPWLAAGLLYSGAGIGLAAVRLLRKAIHTRPVEAPLRRADLPWLAAVVVAGGILAPVLLMFGLARSDAASTSLLLNLEGVATLGIAWLVFREHVDRRLLLGAVSIIAGAVLLSWRDGDAAFNSGAILVALACVAWGIDNNLTRKLSFADPTQVAMIKGISAGAVNLSLSLATGARLPDTLALIATGFVGFIGYGISLVLFVAALRHLGTARTGAYFSLAPFIGAVAGIGFLHEKPGWALLAAGCLMAVGLYLHLAERHDHEHVHEPFEHEHGHVHDEHHRHRHLTDQAAEPRHAHRHRHAPLVHGHRHYPDLHHRHPHPRG